MDLIEAAADAPPHRHPWEIARLSVLRRLIRRRVALDKGATVVDVGCGDAFIIGELARSFPAVRFIGIDAAFTPATAAARQQALPPNVRLHFDLEELAGAAPAALVLLMDVLEHVEDERGFLTGLLGRSVVGPATHVVVTVPAFQALFSSHDVFLKHHRRYTRQQLRRALEGAGLTVVAGGYFFSSLLPIRILSVLRERVTTATPSRGTGLTSYQGGAGVTAAMTALLKADAGVGLALGQLGIHLPGLSTYAICRTSA
jgi:2-polyprenyl-3-methyl-5-hydroxy-6-metoxy-1,4-benzoquinol methylase